MVYLNPQRPQMLTLFHTPQWNVPPSHEQMKQSWTKCVHILVYMYIINKSTNVICYIYIYIHTIYYILCILFCPTQNRATTTHQYVVWVVCKEAKSHGKCLSDVQNLFFPQGTPQILGVPYADGKKI